VCHWRAEGIVQDNVANCGQYALQGNWSIRPISISRYGSSSRETGWRNFSRTCVH
jgi:hypothetical protein